MSKPKPMTDTLSAQETADMLGCKKSKVYQLRKSGALTGHKVGRYRFDRESVLKLKMSKSFGVGQSVCPQKPLVQPRRRGNAPKGIPVAFKPYW